MRDKIRVLLADDHPIVCYGLKELLTATGEMEVLESAVHGEDAVSKALTFKPDLIILDVRMPRQSGIEAARAIRQSLPNAHILMLAGSHDEETIFNAIRAGALGYVTKGSPVETLLQAARAVAHGNLWLPTQLAMRVIQELNQSGKKTAVAQKLTERERDVLKLVARGHTNIQIAETLFLSERTVRTHITNILGKLHLANRTQATLYALRRGMVSLDED